MHIRHIHLIDSPYNITLLLNVVLYALLLFLTPYCLTVQLIILIIFNLHYLLYRYLSYLTLGHAHLTTFNLSDLIISVTTTHAVAGVRGPGG